MIGAVLLVFGAGAIYEASCVGFVHFAERRRPLLTAGCSMLSAACQLTGVIESVHDWRLAAPLILGYGFGTFVAVHAKRTVSPA